jgi:hypothetical protein
MTYLSVTLNGEEVQGYPESEEDEFPGQHAAEAAVSFAADLRDRWPDPSDVVAVVVLDEPPRDSGAALRDRDPNLSTEGRFDLLEDAWNETTKGELNASADPRLASLILAMWDSTDEYTRTMAVDQTDLDRDGDYGVALRIASALSTLWFGVTS